MQLQLHNLFPPIFPSEVYKYGHVNSTLKMLVYKYNYMYSEAALMLKSKCLIRVYIYVFSEGEMNKALQCVIIELVEISLYIIRIKKKIL